MNFIFNKKIFLIGAGPGAKDLITLRAIKILNKAQIILYDSLINFNLLNIYSQSIKILVGKRSGQFSIKQKNINKFFIKYINKYNIIVRLKNGDPMLFSRINEELFFLEYLKIPYEIIPGITSGLASTSFVRIPLTKKGISQNIFFFFYNNNIINNIKFFLNNILIQYMSNKNIFFTIKKLLSIGYSLKTPIILIKNCSLKNEFILYLKLYFFKKKIIKYNGPTIFLIGTNILK